MPAEIDPLRKFQEQLLDKLREPARRKQEIEHAAEIARAQAEAKAEVESRVGRRPKSLTRGRPRGETQWTKMRRSVIRQIPHNVLMAQYCEQVRLQTPPEWQRGGCPKSYCEAWEKKEWQNRIRQERNRAWRGLSDK